MAVSGFSPEHLAPFADSRFSLHFRPAAVSRDIDPGGLLLECMRFHGLNHFVEFWPGKRAAMVRSQVYNKRNVGDI